MCADEWKVRFSVSQMTLTPLVSMELPQVCCVPELIARELGKSNDSGPFGYVESQMTLAPLVTIVVGMLISFEKVDHRGSAERRCHGLRIPSNKTHKSFLM